VGYPVDPMVPGAGPDGHGHPSPTPHGSRRRAHPALALVLLAAVLLGACSFISGIFHTSQQLKADGFGSPHYKFDVSNGYESVGVTVGRSSDYPPRLAAQALPAATAVWDNLPGRFNQLEITVDGVGSRTYTHARLEALLGPRPDSLDAQSLSQTVNSLKRIGLIVIGVVILVVIGVVVLIVLLVRRSRRKRQSQDQDLAMAYLPPQTWGGVAGGAPYPGPAPYPVAPAPYPGAPAPYPGAPQPSPGVPPAYPGTAPPPAPVAPPAPGAPAGPGGWGAPPATGPPQEPPVPGQGLPPG
jgi:hypothetical protein